MNIIKNLRLTKNSFVHHSINFGARDPKIESAPVGGQFNPTVIFGNDLAADFQLCVHKHPLHGYFSTQGEYFESVMEKLA